MALYTLFATCDSFSFLVGLSIMSIFIQDCKQWTLFYFIYVSILQTN